MKFTNICKTCLKKFSVWNYEKNRFFCSYNCYWESMKGRKLPENVIKKLKGRKSSKETIEKRKITFTKTMALKKRNKVYKLKIKTRNIGEKIGKVCLECKKIFFYRKYRENKAKFCSHNCYAKSLLGREPMNKGIKRPDLSGKNHPRWIADRSKLIKRQERNDSAYHNWRMNVWLRDNFKCKINNQDCDGRLEVHHILGWSLYPELRYELNNGITLCHAHHPRRRAEEKRLIPVFQELASVLKV